MEGHVYYERQHSLIIWIKAAKCNFNLIVNHKSRHTLKSSSPFLLWGWNHIGGQIHLDEQCAEMVKDISFLRGSVYVKSSQNSYTTPSSTELVHPA